MISEDEEQGCDAWWRTCDGEDRRDWSRNVWSLMESPRSPDLMEVISWDDTGTTADSRGRKMDF